MTRTTDPTVRDYLVAGLTVAVVVASLTYMVVTVSGGDRTAFVVVVETATWIAATIAIAAILWRRTVWGRRTS